MTIALGKFIAGSAMTLLSTVAFAADPTATINQVQSITNLAVQISYFVGLALFVVGLIRIKKSAESPNQYPMANNIWMILTGVLLLSLGTIYNIVMTSLDPATTSSAKNILSVNDHISGFTGKQITIQGFSKFIPTETGQTLLAFVYMVGLISFIRGIYLLKEIGANNSNNGGVGKSITHILGGAVAMNITQFSCYVGAFIGVDMICLT